MENTINELINLLSSYQFPLSTESQTQDSIEKVLIEKGVSYLREHRFSPKDRVDFFIDGVAVEVKINKGQAEAIYRQCKRYCQHDEVKALILVSNRAMGFPEEIDGKPCYYISLGKSWL